MKMWLHYGVETYIGWPMVRTLVPYAGRAFILHPPADGDSASVSVAYDDKSTYVPPFVKQDETGEPRCSNHDEAVQLMERFLSALAWYSNHGITTHNEQGAGHLYAVPEKSAHVTFYPGEKFEHLVEPTTDEGRLALAFYREGLSVNSVPFQFLGFAKVLNLRLKKGREQIAWINEHIDEIKEVEARLRIEKMKAEHQNIGEYLYHDGRCAVAHALGRSQIVDPDNPLHVGRLRDDLSVIRALARHFIESVLGVNTPGTEAARRTEAFLAARGIRPQAAPREPDPEGDADSQP